MADARALVDIRNVEYGAQTFLYDSSIIFDKTQFGDSAQVGLAVTINGNGQVGLVADAQAVHGKLISVASDGMCTVQTNGGCVFPGGTAATLTPGTHIVGALNGGAKGYVRSVAAATLAEVNVARHTIVDSSDATNVQVLLGR